MAKSLHGATRWFDVDPNGLRQILARQGYGFAVNELVQNAWDAAGVTLVQVSIKSERLGTQLVITDNSTLGVEDLADLYTLFKPSKKADQPLQRGRFNLGEKLAISLASQAYIATRSGTIYFRKLGKREFFADRKHDGTQVALTLPFGAKVEGQLLAAARALLPPVETVLFHGMAPAEEIRMLTQLASFSAMLPTELADAEGHLRPTVRKTTLRLYPRPQGEPALLYELGIPVCEIGTPWHVNVNQKVPLALDRRSVTKAFLSRLYLAILNGAYERITSAEMANESWCREAAGHPECRPEATKHLTWLRFGNRVVANDPSDTEATKRAVAEGYTVVHGGSLSAGEWQNVRETKAFLPAGQVTGTRPVFALPGEGAQPVQELAATQMSDTEAQIVRYIHWLAAQLVGVVQIMCFRDKNWAVHAACGPDRKLLVNFGRLQWWRPNELHGVLIHELAHIRECDHLADQYHHELTRLGAQLAALATRYPAVIAPWCTPSADSQQIAAWRAPDGD